MGKKIIILEKTSGNFQSFKYLFWLDVPPQRKAFYTNTDSAYKAASPAELLAIQNGEVKEIVDTITVNPKETLSNIQDVLQKKWAEAQAELNNDNRWDTLGTYWDGTSWTKGGVS